MYPFECFNSWISQIALNRVHPTAIVMETYRVSYVFYMCLHIYIHSQLISCRYIFGLFRLYSCEYKPTDLYTQAAEIGGPWPFLNLRPLHRIVIFAIENHFRLAPLTFSSFFRQCLCSYSMQTCMHVLAYVYQIY